ncbi:hypothetical protein CAC42_7292 [Sphaceloma murrayae]|uniref:Uncharacterized protein n=1 Tax=Sphaceloma murrayae TaxID=2082308 RepID=A0A2K1QWL6_9PEZI|nr:hypothetical protein CAC42_7292 [Sphaceloma murrayae]
MSITSLYSTSSSGSSRKGSTSSGPGARKMSIELLPNQSIFRETFIGASVPRLSSPLQTPTDEYAPVSPSRHIPTMPGCTACNALSTSPVLRKGSTPSYKRHAVILPTRHHGPFCRMPSLAPRATPGLPSIGEDCLMEWERKGSMSIAVNTPSPSGTPLASPAYAHTAARNTDYFTSAVTSRFSMDTVNSDTLNALPSPKFNSRSHQSPRIGARPQTPVTPTKDYRSFMRMLNEAF